MSKIRKLFHLPLLFSGLIWLMFGFIDFSAGASISSLPESISYTKTAVLTLSPIGAILGFYLLYSSYTYKKKRNNRKISKIIRQNLPNYRFNISILELSKKTGIDPVEINSGVEYLVGRITDLKYSSGIISYSSTEGNNRKNGRNIK